MFPPEVVRTMKKSVLLATTLAAFTLAQPLFAAGNPWLGTWKLNRDKSTLTGITFTVVKTGNMYNFDYGALKFAIGDDGKDYPIMPTRTSSLKMTGKNEWLVVGKVNGVETERSTLKLSSDGKTLTETTTGTRADGSSFKSEETDMRVSGGPDIAGTWKDTKQSSSAPELMTYIDAGPNMLKIDFPASKGSGTYPLDGKPVAETGPRAVPDMTTSFKKISGTELKYVTYIKGKPYFEGMQTVSADGKVLKDVGWLVVKPAEKTTEIFEKE
jgi:hypothetical protein